MKRILYIILLLLASSTACQKEEATYNPVIREQIFLTVLDGGYSSPNCVPSCATNSLTQTVFEAGDQVGFFSVTNNNALEANNVCMTAKEVNGKLVWEAPAGTTLLTANRYFIYYPYQPALTGEVDITKTTAAEFFAGVVAAWKPATDQSTQALYNASDLMIGRGEIGSDGRRPMSVTLNHAMSVVFISLPSLTYEFLNESPAIPDYTLPVLKAEFADFTPLFMGNNIYRYLVRPNMNNTLQGTFTRNSNFKKYSITANVAGGVYKTYLVDGGRRTIIHTLAVGDFYMKDGTLISRDATLTPEQRDNCIGIVLKVGKDPQGSRFEDDADYTLKDGTKSAVIHAYVLALHSGNDNRLTTWGPLGKVVGTIDIKEDAPLPLPSDVPGFRGYKYTKMIKNAVPANSTFKETFPAAYYASDDYETKYPSPVNSSGWFLPSIGQAIQWFENRDILLASLQKTDGTNWIMEISHTQYWTSSEHYYYKEKGAWCIYLIEGGDNEFFEGILNTPRKHLSNIFVRSVLAF